jgi:hypothetical protein
MDYQKDSYVFSINTELFYNEAGNPSDYFEWPMPTLKIGQTECTDHEFNEETSFLKLVVE